jgi:hypothetical protein
MPPGLGDSSREILAERLDVSAEALDALAASGVVR